MNTLRWSDLSVGLSDAFEVTVTAAMMDRFRQDSGDLNPLHADAEYARSRGFDDVVVFGLLTASFYSTLVGVYLPGKHVLLHGVSVDFQRPVYPGTRLRVSGEISHLNEAYRRADMIARITDAGGVRVSKARIGFGVNE